MMVLIHHCRRTCSDNEKIKSAVDYSLLLTIYYSRFITHDARHWRIKNTRKATILLSQQLI
jgi:hypothetical protein